MQVTIIVDASFCPLTGAAGWAAWIRYKNGHLVKHSAEFKSRIISAQEAERRAVVNAIAVAVYKAPVTLTHILAQTDCLAVVRTLTLEQIKKDLGVDFISKHHIPEIAMRHVKGHTGGHIPRLWCNNWRDRVAKVHMKRMKSALKKW